MPLTYKDLKNKRYFEPAKNFAESVLKIKFLNGDRSYCPFHKDTKDSFRIYVNGKDGVLRSSGDRQKWTDSLFCNFWILGYDTSIIQNPLTSPKTYSYRNYS